MVESSHTTLITIKDIESEVVVYLADGTVHTYVVGQTIPGDELLPGFALPVAAIFAV